MTVKDFLPIPNVEACRRLLCVQPHPDDNEVGAGATVAKLARSGCEVIFLTVTDGCKGSLDPSVKPADLAALRQREIEKSAALLGVKRCVSLGIPDGSYPDEELLCRKIAAVIREVKPDMVMTCDPFLPYEAHPDHRRVGMAALEACLFAGNPHFPADPEGRAAPWDVSGIALYNTNAPNTFVDVGATWELKFQALAAHESQFPSEALGQLKVYFDYKAAEYALKAGAKGPNARAEAFKALAPQHLHCCVDTIAL